MNVLFLVECGSSVKIIYLPSLFLGQEVYSQLIVSSFWQSLLKIISISSLFIQKLWLYIWTVSVSSTSCSSKQFLLVLVRVPPPHVREQGPQLDQSGQIRLSLVLTSDTNDFSHSIQNWKIFCHLGNWRYFSEWLSSLHLGVCIFQYKWDDSYCRNQPFSINNVLNFAAYSMFYPLPWQ